MKLILTVLLIFSHFLSFSQSEKVVGEYYCELINTKANRIEYTLYLNKDGTFVFHSYTYSKMHIPNTVNRYGK